MSATQGQVFSYHSIDEWKEHSKEAFESQKMVVIDFTAAWCGPCRDIDYVLDDIANMMPHVVFLKVDVNELDTVADEYNVDAMPTFIFLKEGRELGRIVGPTKEELQPKITEMEKMQPSAEMMQPRVDGRHKLIVVFLVIATVIVAIGLRIY